MKTSVHRRVGAGARRAACGRRAPSTSRRRSRCARCSSRRSARRHRRGRGVRRRGASRGTKRDLAFRIGGKIVARSVDVGARVKKGQVLARLDPADVGLQAEAAEGRGRRGRDRVRVRAGRVRALPEPLSRRSSSARRALDAEAQRARRQSREVRAGEGEARGDAQPGGLRDARRDGGRRRHRGRASKPGQVVDRGPDRRAHRARGRARGGDQRAREPHRRAQARRDALGVVLWANPRKLVSGARARDLARRRSGDAHVRGARVACSTPMPSLQWGMTANVVVQSASRATRRSAAAADVDLSRKDGKPRRVGLRSRRAQGQPARRSTIGQYREDGVVVTSRRCAAATGSWPPACTSSRGARSCGRTRAAPRRRARHRRLRRPRRRAAPRRRRRQTVARVVRRTRAFQSCRTRRRRAALQPLRVGARASLARAVLRSSSSRSSACSRTSGSGSRRTRRSRSR